MLDVLSCICNRPNESTTSHLRGAFRIPVRTAPTVLYRRKYRWIWGSIDSVLTILSSRFLRDFIEVTRISSPRCYLSRDRQQAAVVDLRRIIEATVAASNHTE